MCSDALCLLVRKAAAAILEREEEESWEIRSVWDYIDVSFPREEKELGGREGGGVESHFLLLFFQQLCRSLSCSLLRFFSRHQRWRSFFGWRGKNQSTAKGGSFWRGVGWRGGFGSDPSREGSVGP